MTYREAKGVVSDVKIRMQEIKNFYVHLAAFLTMNTIFVLMNIVDGPDGPVALFPLLIWGFFLLRHARKVFGWKGKNSEKWEKNLMRDLMDGEPLPGEEEVALLAEAPSNVDMIRMKKRIENLEAIIASQNIEELEGR